MPPWFNSRTLMKMFPAVALAIAMLIMSIQFILKLPPFSIATSGGMQRFTSKEGHLSMSYPAGWILTVTPGGDRGDPSIVALIDAPKIPLPGISVVIHQSQTPYDTLTEVAMWGEQVTQHRQAYSVVSTEKIALNGEDTILREYTIQLPESPFQDTSLLRCLDNYRLHNHAGYLLSFCAGNDDFTQLEPTFRRMMDSLAYLDPN